MRRWVTLFLVAWLYPALAFAGTFALSASVDKTQVELGEPLQFTLHLHIEGQLSFMPNVENPVFDGFQVQGPSQAQNINWVNGAFSLEQSYTWELTPIKAGVRVLGPYHARAKDALNGQIDKATNPIKITVTRPKGLGFLPTSPQANPTPEPEETLRDIKPDRPLPWALIGLAMAGFGAMLGLLAWIALRQPKKEEEILPKDPAQLAFSRLEQARQDLAAGGDGRTYAVAVSEVLRQYLRHRLGLRMGLTMSEGMKALRHRAPHVGPKLVPDLRERLELLLYGNVAFVEEDGPWLDRGARDVIRGMEAALEGSPAIHELTKALQRGAASWTDGQVKSGWMAMRAAMLAHLRKTLGERQRDILREKALLAVEAFGAPELVRTVDLVFEEQPPRGNYPQALAERFVRLAEALESVAREAHPYTADEVEDDSSPDDQGER